MLRTSTKIFLLIAIQVFIFINVFAQDSIKSRIILIGDAGKIDKQQQAVLADAANHIIQGKTSVIFLGDNIYPDGMALAGSADSAITQDILRSQFAPMREKNAAVYFVPGNHDWDEMGRNGLAKIRQQWSFLESQQDAFLKLVPANGCPDPVEIPVSDSMVVIAFDSEWWLFTHNKSNPDADCSCNSGKEVIDKMQELFYKNRYKVILLADHHPFQSYGHHGGYFSWKDHIFPLTAISPGLYIPLPVIGSLYPLLRSTFLNPEDLRHPLYKTMIRQVDAVFEVFPNLVHVAGHEHGLQLIKTDQLQVVSGAGAKNAFVKKGKHALFTAGAGGYVTADLLSDNTLRLTYHVSNDTGVAASFSFDKKYTDIRVREDSIHADALHGDSITVQAHASYNDVSRLHRSLFGENYRKEWAAPTKLPIIRISEIKGGLVPLQRGGGHQSKSLRLEDKNGKEWVLRSVNKYPEVLLPEGLRETFAKDIITDAMSAQHPYSALVVPVIAKAAGVPYANPVIGVVAADRSLGIYEKDFVNTVCLLEEREPAGKSDNASKMYRELQKDNDNRYDSTAFLKARLLDLFIGDWDRHEDQWRWASSKKGGVKTYTAIPRDRDQVFHVTEGFFPKIASRPWLAPMLHNFNGEIKRTKGFFIESNTMNKRFLSQFDHEQWMKTTHDFIASMTDSLLEAALLRLPEASYRISHDILIQKWKYRRRNLAGAMEEYYCFLNKTIDLVTSDKNEFVSFSDAGKSGLQVTINKVNKEGKIKEQLFSRIFYPEVTKEIRLYVHDGNDSIIFNDHSSIKIRVIGKGGSKKYHAEQSGRKIQLYGEGNNSVITGEEKIFRTHFSEDSSNTSYVPANPYDKITPVLNAGFNLDDGFLLGGSVKFTNQGFRKKPYANMQQISFLHSFSTSAFRFRFRSEWIDAIGKADIVLDAKALAPDNTQNFFGVGNETVFDKAGDYKRYYRARFAIYQLDPAIRWRFSRSASLTAGLSLQYYIYDADDNAGRLLTHPSLIHSYDSAIVAKDKAFTGITMRFTKDSRNNKLLPTNGAYLNVSVVGYTGISAESRSFMQVVPELAFYKSLDKQSAIVIADRVGGGITAGKTAFYQSLFLGGQENLLGFRQYRFAGKSMVYNNLEARIKIAEVGSYIVPGQLGVIGFYDAGKVWADGFNSKTIHQGVGGGFYFAPAQLAVLQLVAGYSQEGWYPYLTLGVRF